MSYLVTFHKTDPATREIEATEVVLVDASRHDEALTEATAAIGAAIGASIGEGADGDHILPEVGRVLPLLAGDRLRLGLPVPAGAILLGQAPHILTWIASA